MKVITLSEILIFFALLAIVFCLSLFSIYGVSIALATELKFNFLNFLFFSGFFLAYTFTVYYLLRKTMPLPPGIVPDETKSNRVYHLHILFFLLIFHPIILSGICPVPMRRKLYQLLGAKIGFNTYPAGIILDPQFVELGDSCVIGLNSLICPHIMVVGQLSHEPIKIGNNVTISVGATIYGGTTIEEDGKVLPHAVVNPNTHIKAGEIWGGIPAKKIKDGVTSMKLSS